LTAAGATVEPAGPDELTVSGATVDRVGDLAYELGVRLHELSPHGASLERAFMELTADSVEYAGVPSTAGEPR
ncbi:ABC transporter ATP-binding protein, partial [Micromonospora azadirachtae]